MSELDPDLLNLSTEDFLLPVLLPFFTWIGLLIVALENRWVQGSGNPHHLPGVTLIRPGGGLALDPVTTLFPLPRWVWDPFGQEAWTTTGVR